MDPVTSFSIVGGDPEVGPSQSRPLGSKLTRVCLVLNLTFGTFLVLRRAMAQLAMDAPQMQDVATSSVDFMANFLEVRDGGSSYTTSKSKATQHNHSLTLTH